MDEINGIFLRNLHQVLYLPTISHGTQSEVALGRGDRLPAENSFIAKLLGQKLALTHYRSSTEAMWIKTTSVEYHHQLQRRWFNRGNDQYATDNYHGKKVEDNIEVRYQVAQQLGIL